MGVQLNYIPMVTNSLKLNPFTHRAARRLDVASKGDYHLLTLLRVQFHIVGICPVLIASSSFCSMDTSLVGTISDIVTSSTYFQLLERGDTIFKSLIIMAIRIRFRIKSSRI